MERTFFSCPSFRNSYFKLLVAQIRCDSRPHFLRLIPALFDNNPAIGPYQVGVIWCGAIGTPERIIHLVHQHRHSYTFHSYGLAGQLYTLLVGLRLVNRVSRIVISVCRLPSRVYCMRFSGINDNEMYIVSVFFSQGVIGSAPPPEWWSGE